MYALDRISRPSLLLVSWLGLLLAAPAGMLLGAGCGSRSGERKAGDDAGAGAGAGAKIDRTGLRTVRLQAPDTGAAGASAGASGGRAAQPLPRPVSVRLLDPGQGRRQALRYRPDGAPRSFVVTARIRSRELVQRAWGAWVELPVIDYGLDMAVAAGAEAVRVRGRDAVVAAPATGAGKQGAGAGGNAAAVAQARQAADAFLDRYRANVEGRQAAVPVDERGLLGEIVPAAGDSAGKDAGAAAAVAPGPHTQQELAQLLLESVVPFPEEPVGKGARWSASTVLRRGAAVVSQKAEYTLVAVQPDRLRIAVSIRQDGEHQMARVPGLPDGVSAELLALVWMASGEVVVSPASPTPLSGTLAVEYRVHGRLERGLERNEHLIESVGAVELTTTRTP